MNKEKIKGEVRKARLPIGMLTPNQPIPTYMYKVLDFLVDLAISKTAKAKDEEWTKNLRTKFEATLEKFHIGIPIEILIRVEKTTAKAIFDEMKNVKVYDVFGDVVLLLCFAEFQELKKKWCDE